MDLIFPLFVTSNLEREGEFSICEYSDVPSHEQSPLAHFQNCPLIRIPGAGTTLKGLVGTAHKLSCIDPNLEGEPGSSFNPVYAWIISAPGD